MSKRIQDVVIGAGVVGVNCAYQLAAAGRDVLLIDKGEVCSGCSHGNMGWVTPCHSSPIPGPGLVTQTLKWMLRGDSPLYIKPTLRPSLWAWLWRFYRHCNETAALLGLQALAEMNRHVVPLTQELIDQLDLQCAFKKRGVLYVFRTEPGLAKGVRECELLREHGIPSEVLNADEVRRREPAIVHDIAGGINFPSEADLVPDLFVKSLADQLPNLGVQMRMNTMVDEFDRSGRRINAVITAEERIEADNIILAAGSWTLLFAKQLGLRLSIQPGKGYSITFPQQPGAPTVPMNLAEHKVAVTPWEQTVRFGGTMELAGLQLSINQRRVDAILRAAKQYFPDFQAQDVLEVWTGMRPVTSDDLPIIGRSGRYDNLILATGHGMLGVTQSVVTARMVADTLTGREPLVRTKAFSPDRF